MEGHVRKRGETWYYSFETARVNGKRKRKEKGGFRTKKDAEAALRKAIEEYNNIGSVFEPSKVSVSDYMDYWVKNYAQINCADGTIKNYQDIIKNHVKPTLGSYMIKSLTPAILQEFINTRFLNGASKNFLNNIKGLLSGSLKYAVYPCELIRDNPMQYVKLPKYEHTKKDDSIKVITKKEFKKILDRFNPETSFYIPIIIGYYTGCRIGEVMGLTWNDIDLDKGIIDINKSIAKKDKLWYFGPTKNKSSIRRISIGETLIEILKKHKKFQIENRLKYGEYFIQQYEKEEIDKASGKKIRKIYSLPISTDIKVMDQVNMVCTKESGEMITSESFKYAARVIHYELGIQFSFHSLRHTHATILIENGANIKDIQKRLGHSKLATTMDTYAHVTEKMKNDTVDIFEKAIKNLPTK